MVRFSKEAGMDLDGMAAHAKPQSGRRYLKTAEAAEFLRLSARTLEKHRILGTGPRFRKLGRTVRYTVADLEAWADARILRITPRYRDEEGDGQ